MGRKKKIKTDNVITVITRPDEIEIPQLETKEETQQPESDNNIDTNVGESGESSAPEFNIEEIDNIIADAEKGKVEKRGRKSKEEKARVALTIPGSLFVRMHVMVASNGLSAIDTLIAKKNAIPADLLALDEKTIQELAPVAELAMKQMKLEENPVAAFYIMFGAGILTNYLSVKALIKQAMKENPNFNVNELKK